MIRNQWHCCKGRPWSVNRASKLIKLNPHAPNTRCEMTNGSISTPEQTKRAKSAQISHYFHGRQHLPIILIAFSHMRVTFFTHKFISHHVRSVGVMFFGVNSLCKLEFPSNWIALREVAWVAIVSKFYTSLLCQIHWALRNDSLLKCENDSG